MIANPRTRVMISDLSSLYPRKCLRRLFVYIFFACCEKGYWLGYVVVQPWKGSRVIGSNKTHPRIDNLDRGWQEVKEKSWALGKFWRSKWGFKLAMIGIWFTHRIWGPVDSTPKMAAFDARNGCLSTHNFRKRAAASPPSFPVPVYFAPTQHS